MSSKESIYLFSPLSALWFALVPQAEAGAPSVRRGMDLVRVGNIGSSGVAFFFDRRSMPPPLDLMRWIDQEVFKAIGHN